MKKLNIDRPILYTEPLDLFFEKWADKLLFIFIGVYVVLFSVICFLKYYSFGYLDWDFASDVIILWNSLHGRLLYYPFLEQNILGAHLFLIYFLIMPFYFIFQHPLALLFLQSLILGFGAYPLYLIARSVLSKTFALAIALVYLLYPSVGFMNLFETHFDSYAIFFLFFAIYFFQKSSFFKFVIFLLLAIICKESTSLVVFMFGIYAFFRKRSSRWIFTPLILGAGWFIIALKLVIPYFARDARLYQEGFIFSIYYKHLGSNVAEMMRTIIFNPAAVARYAFTPDKILYIFQLFSPVGFLSFFSPLSLLMTVPIFMQNLLSSAFTHSKIYYQYTGLLIPFIFAAAVFGLKRFFEDEANFKKRVMLLSIILIASVVSGFFYKAPQFFLGAYFREYAIDDEALARKELVRMIPPRAPALATFKFLPWLANRRDLYSLHFVTTGYRMYTKERYVVSEGLEYALIDFNEPLMLSSFFPPEAPTNLRSFLEEGSWKTVAGVGDTVLFAKNRPDGYALHEAVMEPKIDKPMHADIDGQLEFRGCNISDQPLGKSRVLHMTTFWRRPGVIKEELAFFVLLLNDAGEAVSQHLHTTGYRAYPPAEWPQDKISIEHVFVLLNGTVRPGTYHLRGGIIGLSTGRILPIIDDGTVDAFGSLDLGTITLAR